MGLLEQIVIAIGIVFSIYAGVIVFLIHRLMRTLSDYNEHNIILQNAELKFLEGLPKRIVNQYKYYKQKVPKVRYVDEEGKETNKLLREIKNKLDKKIK